MTHKAEGIIDDCIRMDNCDSASNLFANLTKEQKEELIEILKEEISKLEINSGDNK